jgi:primosomal protein N' (replication factor Y)
MDFLDIVFPVNISPLTYKCSEELSKIAKPGMLVSAPLKNRLTKGIIMGKPSQIPSGDMKDIQNVHGDLPVFSSKMISLLKWMSEYYIAEQGLVLKNMLPREAFLKVKKRKKIAPAPPPQKEEPENHITDINDIFIADLIKSFNKDTYKTFLLQTPSAAYEYSFLIELFPEIKNAILLVPELSNIHTIHLRLQERFGERACLFHSDLSRGERSEAIEKILSGHSDIVLGTRSAIFAPLRKVSFIAVLHEHSNSYKQENSPCYNARDVAVMRGYIEKASVLLSSISPSIESLYNCKSGKYTLLKATDDVKRPRIKVIDMRYEKHIKPYLSKAVGDASARYIEHDKKIMFVVNRRGYSTLLQCKDCNHIEECPDCSIPLVFHKQDISLKCHYCGYRLTKVPETCNRCKGYNLQLLGAGTQKVQEDLEHLFGMKTLRLDSDRTRKKSELKGLIGDAFAETNRIIIGTKLMIGRLDRTGGFSMAAILNTDILLNLPDFRSTEKAYQEISSVIDKIEPGGEVFIQTRTPRDYLFRCLKNYDYISFFNEELQRRKILRYPPYSRLVLIKFISTRDLYHKLSGIQKSANDIEILGPYVSKNKQGKNEFKLLLKSSVRGKLHAAAKSFIESFKGSKDVRIKIDVDPIVI